MQALEAARRRISSEVRSIFFDLEQADRVLEAETKNAQSATDSLQIAKANLAAGLGTQLDVLQAASDVTRTQTTRLSAIYLHNSALARLARACAWPPEAIGSDPNSDGAPKTKIFNLAHPPAKLNQQ